MWGGSTATTIHVSLWNHFMLDGFVLGIYKYILALTWLGYAGGRHCLLTGFRSRLTRSMLISLWSWVLLFLNGHENVNRIPQFITHKFTGTYFGQIPCWYLYVPCVWPTQPRNLYIYIYIYMNLRYTYGLEHAGQNTLCLATWPHKSIYE
jgi:hypothetical protein